MRTSAGNDRSGRAVRAAVATIQDVTNTSVGGYTQGSGRSKLFACIFNFEGCENTTIDNDGNISSDSNISSDEGSVCDMEISVFFGNYQELEREPNLEEDAVDDKEENNYMTEG